jgi:hypothetical protein
MRSNLLVHIKSVRFGELVRRASNKVELVHWNSERGKHSHNELRVVDCPVFQQLPRRFTSATIQKAMELILGQRLPVGEELTTYIRKEDCHLTP